jgi:tetratricopeptide (TPR) repeat protein
MFRKFRIGVLTFAVVTAFAQERRPRIDVQHYTINAEINPETQTLNARVQVRFIPQDGSTNEAVFELNNALNVSKVEDDNGRQVNASRSQQDFTVRLTFPDALAKGTAANAVFYYDGKLTGNEESPVYGIKFAAIHPDYAFLLYPARWFPLNGYTSDRYSTDMKVTVPEGYKVIASGLESRAEAPAGKVSYVFSYTHESFPGSIAVVKGEGVKVGSEGVTTTLYFRGAQQQMANGYGQEMGKVMTFLTSLYGPPPEANLALVQTEDGAPNGYAGPGILFLSPNSIGQRVSTRLLANQVSRQWWGVLVSPISRNHLWITNGFAKYSELLYLEHTSGASALEADVHDIYVEAMTVDNARVIETAKLDDYSPEYWALTSAKGAAVLHMLRYVIGNDNFDKLAKTFADQHAWGSVSTADFEKAAEAISGQNLQGFFIQWIESTGAPEFQRTYTILRTQKGFRVMGKITQDLDTFRMPVEIKIETEGNPEEKKIDVAGISSEFTVDTFGKPKNVIIDPNERVLRYSTAMRVAVSIKRGEQFTQVSEFPEALKEYQRALEVNKNSSLAHYRVAEVFYLQNSYQSAANEFRESLNGDLEPKWTEVWSRIKLGCIFDITGQRERAVNEYQQAIRTKDNTQGAQEEAGKYLKTPCERQRRDDLASK